MTLALTASQPGTQPGLPGEVDQSSKSPRDPAVQGEDGPSPVGDTDRGAEGAVLEPSEAMCDAARGLIMMDRFGLPSAKSPLSECARSGFYGEHWRHLLDDDERDFAHRLPKGHLASLIWRAMESARLRPTPPAEQPVTTAREGQGSFSQAKIPGGAVADGAANREGSDK